MMKGRLKNRKRRKRRVTDWEDERKDWKGKLKKKLHIVSRISCLRKLLKKRLTLKKDIDRKAAIACSI